MVLLAVTPKGLAEAVQVSAKTGQAVWCGAAAISDQAFSASSLKNVTRLVYGLAGDDVGLIKDALGTIAEHHPGESIWVEAIQE